MLKGIFSGIHGMPLMRMHGKKDSFCTSGGNHALFNTSTKLPGIRYKFYGPDVIVYILTVVVFYDCVLINSTFLGHMTLYRES